VVGENAVSSQSRVQEHGLLEHRGTYQIMRPQDVGLARPGAALDRDSSPQALRQRVRDLGFEPGDAQFARVLDEFTALASRKKSLFDGDIEALVLRAEGVIDGPWSLGRLATTSASGARAQATVALRHADGRAFEREASGDGPVDAAFKAIELATGVRVTLRKFELRSLSEGEDAQGEALVSVEHDGRSYRGASVSTDIVEAATRAFLEVINRIEMDARPSGARRDAGFPATVPAPMIQETTPRRAALEQERTP
jgi:2-isopropylmalate synthase